MNSGKASVSQKKAALSTKERIIGASLKLFSEKGYEGVSMREIAAAVDIKAASLYAHFKGKEAIYQAIVETMQKRYQEETAYLSLDGSNPAADVPVYEHISADALFALGKELFLFFVHDVYTSRYRKMLTIDQFRLQHLAEEYSRQYYDEAIGYQKQLFGMLVEAGSLKKADCEVMAVQFYAPIHMFIQICDRQPEREAEVLELLKRHIHQFAQLYCVEETAE